MRWQPVDRAAIEAFATRVSDARRRLEVPRGDEAVGDSVAVDRGGAPELALLALLEEIGVAEEELRAQNDALEESRIALERERSHYKELFDLAPDAYIATDRHGRITDANGAATELFGIARQFLPGKVLTAFVPVEERRQFRVRLLNVLADPSRHEWRGTILGRDADRVVEFRAVAMGEQSSEARSVRWLIRDIADQVRSERQVQEVQRSLERRVDERTGSLNEARAALQGMLERERQARHVAEHEARARTELLTFLSHEFRTPLQAISGYAELLEIALSQGNTAEASRLADRIQVVQRDLLHLITNILDFEKIARGDQLAERHAVQLPEVIGRVRELLGPELEHKRLSLTIDGPSDVEVRASPFHLERIVVNLLSNAVKFTPPDGRIDVSWYADGAQVCLLVRDTGRGIPRDLLDLVFEPYVQADVGLGRQGMGTGLGLAISRTLARGMDGELAVSSEFGYGSTFVLRLPRAGAIEAPSPATVGGEPPCGMRET